MIFPEHKKTKTKRSLCIRRDVKQTPEKHFVFWCPTIILTDVSSYLERRIWKDLLSDISLTSK